MNFSHFWLTFWAISPSSQSRLLKTFWHIVQFITATDVESKKQICQNSGSDHQRCCRWFHGFCVGVLHKPSENANWLCPLCGSNYWYDKITFTKYCYIIPMLYVVVFNGNLTNTNFFRWFYSNLSTALSHFVSFSNHDVSYELFGRLAVQCSVHEGVYCMISLLFFA